jgi:uncharacterized membrane protein
MKLRLNWSFIVTIVGIAVFWMLLSKVLGWMFAIALSFGVIYVLYRWFLIENSRG